MGEAIGPCLLPQDYVNEKVVKIIYKARKIEVYMQ